MSVQNNSNEILVTYASHTGSTAEIAAFMADTLRQAGYPAVARPMSEVQDIKPYRAVIAGSAIHSQQWLPDAKAFLQRHQADLKTKPFAAFLVCIALWNPNERTVTQVKTWLQPVRELVSPQHEGFFAGILDLKKTSFGHRLLFRLGIWTGMLKEGDFRDWDAIKAWTEGFVPMVEKA